MLSTMKKNKTEGKKVITQGLVFTVHQGRPLCKTKSTERKEIKWSS